jgi:hypothetical protein
MRLTKKQRQIIHGIRREIHEAFGGDLRVCDNVAYDIECLIGWPMVEGDCDHDDCLMYHCWNFLPDGSILDATADQFDLPPIMVLERNHKFFPLYHPRATQGPIKASIEQAREELYDAAA